MGRALIGGLLRSGTRPSTSASASRSLARARRWRVIWAISASADNLAAVSGAAVVVLAVKPQDAAAVLAALAGQWGAPGPLLISVPPACAWRPCRPWCGPGRAAVVRATPNRAALLGAAAPHGPVCPATGGGAQRATGEQVFSPWAKRVVATEDALGMVVTPLGQRARLTSSARSHGEAASGRARRASRRPRK